MEMEDQLINGTTFLCHYEDEFVFWYSIFLYLIEFSSKHNDTLMRKCFDSYVVKVASQPEHQRSVIDTCIIHCLDSVSPLDSFFKSKHLV